MSTALTVKPFHYSPRDQNSYQFIAVIHAAKDHGCGIVVAHWSSREALSMVDRAYLLRDGRVLASGTPDQIRRPAAGGPAT